ncbi:Cell growth-regulating nucleolar protein [Eumeta japonica]|uniref:Cell growth-regulating nucleolar protein n=1 Tax=Eumeta variegata TaxID=151549 RepID=A0A4C1VPQ8_EUMVA|nr:Cell growth-regulating nucleolar protein [Eumeta japonica]
MWKSVVSAYAFGSGEDYQVHIKCITEEERYGKKDFVAKEKKGEQKQNIWVEMIKAVLDEHKDLSRNVLNIIQSVSQHTNTPRKKPKFVNFVKNVCGHKTNPKDIDSAWELIAAKLPTLSNQNHNKTQNLNNKLNDSINDSVSDSVNNLHIVDTSVDEQTQEKQQNGTAEGKSEIKAKTKKEKKDEKKKKKYEAELHSVAQPVEEVNEIKTKKEKKKKPIYEACANGNDDECENKKHEKSKNKKRKRLDTVNSVRDVSETEPSVEAPTDNAVVEHEATNGMISTQKTKKKKQKTEEDKAEESICLHDQNVANAAQAEGKGEKFNWHEVIISVLEKKGDEIPFKRLQKKVLGEYSEMTGLEVDDRIADKFIKKLKSAPNVLVDKNRVVLLR